MFVRLVAGAAGAAPSGHCDQGCLVPQLVEGRAAEGSLNFGVYGSDGAQAGYARLVTDGATFGWLCDVYIAREARGRGLGTALARTVVEAVRPLGLKRLILVTEDAHAVYARAGFEAFPDPGELMVLAAPDAR
ncbi:MULTISPECIES: GNAT family N-acetyltransferase [Streptomyces]|uniref:GNAT family N-acetyltransferase n=1 Tax=Streptomyces TaxID=1883 RepID=UPI000EF86A38|nr:MULTISPECIES: GNAT family N-acetyltransferase [Streptomyces]RZD56683.1 GNAT family N-acetyltransferase [Streptomyces albidoflavus]